MLSRFRTALTKAGVYEKLLEEINRQLEKHHVLIKKGSAVLVDASLTATPLCPKGKSTYQIVEDRSETPRSEEETQKEEQTHRLLKKAQE